MIARSFPVQGPAADRAPAAAASAVRLAWVVSPAALEAHTQAAPPMTPAQTRTPASRRTPPWAGTSQSVAIRRLWVRAQPAERRPLPPAACGAQVGFPRRLVREVLAASLQRVALGLPCLARSVPSNAVVSGTNASPHGNATRACALTQVRPPTREAVLASTWAAPAPRDAIATATILVTMPSSACRTCAWQSQRQTPGSTLEIRSPEFDDSKPRCAWR